MLPAFVQLPQRRVTCRMDIFGDDFSLSDLHFANDVHRSQQAYHARREIYPMDNIYV